MSATCTLPVSQGCSLGGMSFGSISLSSVMMATDTTNRRAVAEGLRHRDRELLDELIEQYQFRLFRYLLYLTAHRERAEDFFQETWLRVLERGHQYDGKSKFESWLFTIARNLVIDWQRQKKMPSLDTLTDPAQEQPLQFADTHNPSPLHLAMSGQQDAAVRASLDQLAVIYREVVRSEERRV